MSIDVSISIPDFSQKSAEAQAEVPLLIAASLQTQRGMIFKNEGAYNGHDAWEPLKFRHGQILADSGKLKNSIAPRHEKGKPGKSEGSIVEIAPDIVTVGTDIAYASIHQYGRIYHGTPDMPLAFEVPWMVTSQKTGKLRKKGTFWVFCQKIVIPPRPFANVNNADSEEIAKAVSKYYSRLL